MAKKGIRFAVHSRPRELEDLLTEQTGYTRRQPLFVAITITRIETGYFDSTS